METLIKKAKEKKDLKWEESVDLVQYLLDTEKLTDHPEFDAYKWVSYWYPLGQVIPFKRDVYRRAMTELAPALRWFGPMAC